MPARPLASTPLSRLISLLLCSALLAPQLLLFPAGVSLAAPTRNYSRRAARTRSSAKPQTAQRAGELLVGFRPDAPEQEITDSLSAVGIQRGRRLRGESGIERMAFSAGQDADTIIATLRLNPLVQFAEPNFLITADEVTPNDPHFIEQWGLRNYGTAAGQYGADIMVGQAWETTTGSPNTVIAVIDSGIDFTHPDLGRNGWNNRAEQLNRQDDDHNGYADDLHGWDWIGDDNQIKDEQGHGTAIAGIIAAEGNNGLGISGVMWRASLMNLRVLDGTGTGDIARAVEAIDYATAHGAQIINCSWGTDAESIALFEALQRAAKRGVLVVCSAGNDGRSLERSPRYPASYELDNVITIAATDSTDNLAAKSNWGEAHVTLAAPGVDLLSTSIDGDYRLVSGTSAAAPFVTGIAGLAFTRQREPVQGIVLISLDERVRQPRHRDSLRAHVAVIIGCPVMVLQPQSVSLARRTAQCDRGGLQAAVEGGLLDEVVAERRLLHGPVRCIGVDGGISERRIAAFRAAHLGEPARRIIAVSDDPACRVDFAFEVAGQIVLIAQRVGLPARCL